MSELSAGLRAWDMHERVAYHRERARKERDGVVREETGTTRRVVRWVRRAG